MSSYDRWDPEYLLVCPLDDTHRITAKRFQRHIVKCRKNHPDKDTATCPYNATHIVLRPDLRKHLANCPDSRAIDADIIQARCEETGEIERIMGNVSLPENNWQSPDDSEDWDKEAEQHEYEKCAKITEEMQMAENVHGNSRPRRPNFENKMSSGVTNFVRNDQSRDRTEKSSTNSNHASFSSNATKNSSYVRMAGRGIRTAGQSENKKQYNPPGRFHLETKHSVGRGTKFDSSPG